MLNKHNIQIMIDTFIRLDKAPLPEYPDKGFNIGSSDFDDNEYKSNEHSCGTAACITGWTGQVFGYDTPAENHMFYRGAGDVHLGISDTIMARSLFTPRKKYGCNYHYLLNPEKFTLRAAIRVLEILRDTGKVDWNEAIANPWSPEDETKSKYSDPSYWLVNPTLNPEPENKSLVKEPK